MKFRRCLLVVLLLIIASSTLASDREITLMWEPSPSFKVNGYNVYFKRGNTDFFSQSTIVNEGRSPIDAGRSLTTQLSGVPDEDIYYFAVTAYTDDSESDFSNIVSNSWMPSLITPRNRAYSTPLPVTFQWGAHAEINFNYILYYGPHKNDILQAGLFVAPHHQGSNTYQLLKSTLLMCALLCMMIMTLNLLQRYKDRASTYSRRMKYQEVVIVFLALALVSCGGGGGSSTEITRVNAETSTYYQVFDLQPATTYFWKIVASEHADPSKTNYHSDIFSFTTE